ncbi:hypothetical protein ACIKP9_13140 [Methylobacillus methanolivorans]|uniref:Uncharacterized protein n=1 Tax=Methylobacillus methanolivorans TaxID=1848927 RepID=A0ABW8GP88_9PROT
MAITYRGQKETGDKPVLALSPVEEDVSFVLIVVEVDIQMLIFHQKLARVSKLLIFAS